jgi:hypothetical protein
MEFIQNVTIQQVAAFILFIGGLYGGVKYLKKELKDGIMLMLKDQFDGINKKFENDDKRIKALEDQSVFLFKAISLLLEDDLAILEHLRTSNNTGKMAEQEDEVHKFLTEVKVGK